MKRFSFPLDRVLDWKTIVAQQEQQALETLNGERAEFTSSLQRLNDSICELSETAYQAESGHDLAYSAQARSALLRSRVRTEQQRDKCDTKIASQQEKLRTAETERRLVTKLKERSYNEWSSEIAREMDSTAADLFLGTWNRK